MYKVADPCTNLVKGLCFKKLHQEARYMNKWVGFKFTVFMF
ncbi:hypothetical protein HanPSC8_Chr10g0432961 [Helianthus annuus]|nr:hypothetical protein HanPSC8_Chr10g0432961 [Helianthus annuus]